MCSSACARARTIRSDARAPMPEWSAHMKRTGLDYLAAGCEAFAAGDMAA